MDLSVRCLVVYYRVCTHVRLFTVCSCVLVGVRVCVVCVRVWCMVSQSGCIVWFTIQSQQVSLVLCSSQMTGVRQLYNNTVKGEARCRGSLFGGKLGGLSLIVCVALRHVQVVGSSVHQCVCKCVSVLLCAYACAMCVCVLTCGHYMCVCACIYSCEGVRMCVRCAVS